MQIRAATLDEPAAAAVLGEYLAMRRATWPPERGVWDAPLPDPAGLVPPFGALLVAEDGGDLVGCGAVRLLDPATAEVKHLYLRAAARGRGWGRGLLTALEEQARSLGASAVVLDTNDTLVAAQRLYRSAGYVEVARYNDNPRATHWFRKDLPAGDAQRS